MTQDQQGRWRMGPREWIAFIALLVVLIMHAVTVVVWMVRLESKVGAAEKILSRLDERREADAVLAQRVGDMERRVASLEEFLRGSFMRGVMQHEKGS